MNGNDSLPLTGYPGAGFHAIHLMGLASILVSTIASVTVLCYMFRCRKNVPSFYAWALGERLVVYLALIDICWGINHGVDHIVIYATLRHPPRGLCIFFGFALQLFMSAQSLLVMFAACNAFFLLVKQKRVNLGRGDWRLLTFCFAPPAVIGGILAGLGYLGQNGAWCHVDMRKDPEGQIIYTVYSTMVLGVFVINSVCYTSVGITLKRSADRVAKYDADGSTDKYKRVINTCKSLTFIVAAYIFQWWPFVVLTVWSYIAKPHVAMLVVVVTFCNAGGIFNAIAYTVMKVRNRQNNNKSSVRNNGLELKEQAPEINSNDINEPQRY